MSTLRSKDKFNKENPSMLHLSASKNNSSDEFTPRKLILAEFSQKSQVYE